MMWVDDQRGASALDSRVAAFARDGFLGPIRVFSAAECRHIAEYLHRSDHPPPPDWEKGRAVRERFLFDLATHPTVMALVTAVLGDDVVLWGASAIVRRPGASHPWHSDIESSTPAGGFATVWIGVDQTSRESALQVISRSHTLGQTVQQCRVDRGLSRDDATPEAMLAAAREREPRAALLNPDMTNGDALLFDGRLWHGSHNSRKRGRRVALLFQYAATDSLVRIPDFTQLDWPFHLRAEPRPPVILVSGTDHHGINRLTPAPPPHPTGLPMVSTAIHHFDLCVDHPTSERQVCPAFRGPTATLGEISCHASLLSAGPEPHPPHAHREEELLISLEGDAELVIPAGPDDPVPRVEWLSPGSFAYYPAGQYHTIRRRGTGAISYLMFKWHAPPTIPSTDRPSLRTTVCHYADTVTTARARPRPFHTREVLEGPTSYLGSLHAHVTTLQPGAGYVPHVDAHDVAIVTLSGTVETLGQRVDPMSVVYYAAGESHGMRNIGTDVARYIVFEFHSPGVRPVPIRGPIHRALARRVLRMGKGLARPIWHRLQGR
jgi:mannose-6-phosphate isomerase-like protein (cupin superfamily)